MATAEDIQFHYDVDNDFYALFLDDALRAYSCGVWKTAVTLDEAQFAKINRMCSYARIEAGSRVLDIGCGWGGLMRYAVNVFGAECAHGLTLSKDQVAYIASLEGVRISAALKTWQGFSSVGEKYDAIASVGAFEHFVSRDERLQGKQRQIYREFFQVCRQVSTDRAYLGLQTIVTARQPETLQEARDARYLLDKVFPGSALPSVSDVQAAAVDLYEMAAAKRIGLDYARTLACWRDRLVVKKDIATERFGAATVDHYIRYFDAAERSFASGVTDLLQVSFKPVAGMPNDRHG